MPHAPRSSPSGRRPCSSSSAPPRERAPGGTPVRVHQEDTAQALAATHKYEADGGRRLRGSHEWKGSARTIDRPSGVQLDGGQCGRTREEPLGAGAGHEDRTTRARLRRALHGDVPRGARRARDHARRGEAAGRRDGIEHREGGADDRSGSGRHARAHGKARRASRRGGTLREARALRLRITVRDQVRGRATRASRWLDAGTDTTRTSGSATRRGRNDRERQECGR